MRLCVDDCVSSHSPKTCTVDLLDPPNCSEILMCKCDDRAFIFLPPEIVIHPSYTDNPGKDTSSSQGKDTEKNKQALNATGISVYNWTCAVFLDRTIEKMYYFIIRLLSIIDF